MYCFIDNPEIMANVTGFSFAQRVAFIRSCANAVNCPLYEERVVQVPVTTRRKRFDQNNTVALNNVDVLDRSCQTMLIAAVVAGPANTAVGQFEYHDVVDVEGMNLGAT